MELVENEEEENGQENSEKKHWKCHRNRRGRLFTEEVAMIKKIDIILLIL